MDCSLAIETSSRLGSVALGDGGELIAERTFTAVLRHGVELLATVHDLLTTHSLKASEIRRIFVSAGPGSFTGLRVGFTFARALAQICGVGLVPVPTCRVIVENLRDGLADQTEPSYVAAVLDAKRKQVYAAAFCRRECALEEILEAQVISPKELLSKLPRPLYLTGEGIDYHRDELTGEGVVVVEKDRWQPTASNVLKLGWSAAQRQEPLDYNRLVPTYIRLPEAEERRRSGTLKRKY